MNNGKYHTESYKLGQQAKVNKLFGPVEIFVKLCSCCGKEYNWQGRKNTKAFELSKFCSRSCANNRQQIWDNKIKDGESHGKYVRYRDIAINAHGAKCVICKFDKIIEVHHLDHNRDNNSKENLIPLCPNHHMMLHRSKYANEVKLEIKNYINGL